MSIVTKTWSAGQPMELYNDSGELLFSVGDNGVDALKRSPTAVTATADGTGTGVIASGTGFALVTSAGANNIATLPTPVAGDHILIAVGANGCELRSDDPENVAINGGTAANAELALAANSLAICIALSATAWLVLAGSPSGGFNMAAAGA